LDLLGIDFQPAKTATDVRNTVFFEALEAGAVPAWKKYGANGDFEADWALAFASINQSQEASPLIIVLRPAAWLKLFPFNRGFQSQTIFNRFSNTVFRKWISHNFNFFESFSYFLFSC
jgi:hypothetical protein